MSESTLEKHPPDLSKLQLENLTEVEPESTTANSPASCRLALDICGDLSENPETWHKGGSRRLELESLLGGAEAVPCSRSGTPADTARWSREGYRRRELEALVSAPVVLQPVEWREHSPPERHLLCAPDAAEAPDAAVQLASTPGSPLGIDALCKEAESLLSANGATAER
eukprot:TRINITY_DN100021_c0_g1_i1.p1 TRINITY_DN100021_c0_g1~~TRINITY_DN100021_c0_g1_i1.p1  ORF type:complete len:178 (-),score=39.95 TRINITY_DN100021_c0_g1_i1:64-573(-)